MKNTFLLLALIFSIKISMAQYCVPGRFDSKVFDLSQIDSATVQYGQNYNWRDSTIQKLYMDVYFPKLSADTLKKRPVIMLIHPGGFYLGRREHYHYHCRQLAMRGFVAISIDYRLGWEIGLGKYYDTLPPKVTGGYPFKCEGDSVSSLQAFYRALQDQKAALRYIIHNGWQVHIDPDWIFVGGSSAGGVSSLGLQYVSQELFDNKYADLHLSDSLGPLDFSSNSLTDSFSLAGMFSFWGALPDTSLITADNSIPALLMHCTGDSLVPCGSNNYYSCSNYLRAQGSCEIWKRLKHLGECYEFNYYDAPYPQNACHGVYSYDYRIERISKFAKRLFCSDCRQITVENQVIIANDSIGATGIEEHSIRSGGPEIYPNPAGSRLFISSAIPVIGVRIYSLSGKLLSSLNSEAKKIEISTESLIPGLYLVQLILKNNTSSSAKVIIQ